MGYKNALRRKQIPANKPTPIPCDILSYRTNPRLQPSSKTEQCLQNVDHHAINGPSPKLVSYLNHLTLILYMLELWLFLKLESKMLKGPHLPVLKSPLKNCLQNLVGPKMDQDPPLLQYQCKSTHQFLHEVANKHTNKWRWTVCSAERTHPITCFTGAQCGSQNWNRPRYYPCVMSVCSNFIDLWLESCFCFSMSFVDLNVVSHFLCCLYYELSYQYSKPVVCTAHTCDKGSKENDCSESTNY